MAVLPPCRTPGLVCTQFLIPNRILNWILRDSRLPGDAVPPRPGRLYESSLRAILCSALVTGLTPLSRKTGRPSHFSFPVPAIGDVLDHPDGHGALSDTNQAFHRRFFSQVLPGVSTQRSAPAAGGKRLAPRGNLSLFPKFLLFSILLRTVFFPSRRPPLVLLRNAPLSSFLFGVRIALERGGLLGRRRGQVFLGGAFFCIFPLRECLY